MAARPGRLLATGLPRRAAASPEADWAAMLALVAWAEGHGHCGGLRATAGGLLACPCGGLTFEVGDPQQTTGEAA
jgi:hypothetical protein